MVDFSDPNMYRPLQVDFTKGFQLLQQQDKLALETAEVLRRKEQDEFNREAELAMRDTKIAQGTAEALLNRQRARQKELENDLLKRRSSYFEELMDLEISQGWASVRESEARAADLENQAAQRKLMGPYRRYLAQTEAERNKYAAMSDAAKMRAIGAVMPSVGSLLQVISGMEPEEAVDSVVGYTTGGVGVPNVPGARAVTRGASGSIWQSIVDMGSLGHLREIMRRPFSEVPPKIVNAAEKKNAQILDDQAKLLRERIAGGEIQDLWSISPDFGTFMGSASKEIDEAVSFLEDLDNAEALTRDEAEQIKLRAARESLERALDGTVEKVNDFIEFEKVRLGGPPTPEAMSVLRKQLPEYLKRAVESGNIEGLEKFLDAVKNMKAWPAEMESIASILEPTFKSQDSLKMMRSVMVLNQIYESVDGKSKGDFMASLGEYGGVVSRGMSLFRNHPKYAEVQGLMQAYPSSSLMGAYGPPESEEELQARIFVTNVLKDAGSSLAESLGTNPMDLFSAEALDLDDRDEARAAKANPDPSQVVRVIGEERGLWKEYGFDREIPAEMVADTMALAAASGRADPEEAMRWALSRLREAGSWRPDWRWFTYMRPEEGGFRMRNDHPLWFARREAAKRRSEKRFMFSGVPGEQRPSIAVSEEQANRIANMSPSQATRVLLAEISSVVEGFNTRNGGGLRRSLSPSDLDVRSMWRIPDPGDDLRVPPPELVYELTIKPEVVSELGLTADQVPGLTADGNPSPYLVPDFSVEGIIQSAPGTAEDVLGDFHPDALRERINRTRREAFLDELERQVPFVPHGENRDQYRLIDRWKRLNKPMRFLGHELQVSDPEGELPDADRQQ